MSTDKCGSVTIIKVSNIFSSGKESKDRRGEDDTKEEKSGLPGAIYLFNSLQHYLHCERRNGWKLCFSKWMKEVSNTVFFCRPSLTTLACESFKEPLRPLLISNDATIEL